MSTDGAARDLIYVCEVCDLPVEDEEGFVQVDAHRATTHLQEEEEFWEPRDPQSPLLEFRNAGEMMNFYDNHPPAKWEVMHWKCDPDPESAHRWGRIEKMRTTEGLLRWMLHYGGKRWMDGTNWIGFCWGALDRTARRGDGQ